MTPIMKAVLAVALVLALSCTAALASVGDVITQKTKAYADPKAKKVVGAIPQNTSVMVEAYGKSVSKINVKNRTVYVPTASLMCKASAKSTVTLKKGVEVYQQPSFFSTVFTLKSDAKAEIYSTAGNWTLIRNPKNSVYAWVPTMDIE